MSSAAVTCAKCGTGFEVDTVYFQKFGREPICQDCLVHTECASCNRGLRLRPSRYKELGGDPIICKECDETGGPSASRGGSFWTGLSIGEKIVFPILLVAFVGILAISVLASQSGVDVEAPILLPILLLLYWLYRRGRKNRAGS